jgi:hypothetical protein
MILLPIVKFIWKHKEISEKLLKLLLIKLETLNDILTLYYYHYIIINIIIIFIINIILLLILFNLKLIIIFLK